MIDHRGKLALSRRHLHHLLGLHADVKVTGFYTTSDPKYLMVELAGEPLAKESFWGPDDLDDCEMRIAKIEDVQRNGEP